MPEFISLSTLIKTSVTTDDYILVANSKTNAAKKLQLQSLFPSVSNAGSGEDLFSTATLANKNQILFKGIDAEGAINVDTVNNNIIISLSEQNIDLSNCDNSVSGFITGIDFSGTVSGQCAVVNGGTGLATIAKGAVLTASAANTLSASNVLDKDGYLLMGDTATGAPVVGQLAAGANISLALSSGQITISASLQSLADVLDTASYNINLRGNYISEDGTSKGLGIYNGNVVVNPSASTLTTADLVGQINLHGSNQVAINIGNSSAYQSSYYISTLNAPSGAGSARLHILGANNSSGFQGGDIYITPGSSSNAGGSLYLSGGDGTTTAGGEIILRTFSGGTPTTSLKVTNKNEIFNYGKTYISESLYLRGGSGPEVVKRQVSPATTDDGVTAITAANILTGIVLCTPTADRTKPTDTADNLISTLQLKEDNDSVDFTLINLSTDGTSEVSISAGSNVTLVGRMTVMAQDSAENDISEGVGRFRVRRTSSTTVTLYRIS